jgi:hypothetical protein
VLAVHFFLIFGIDYNFPLSPSLNILARLGDLRDLDLDRILLVLLVLAFPFTFSLTGILPLLCFCLDPMMAPNANADRLHRMPANVYCNVDAAAVAL